MDERQLRFRVGVVVVTAAMIAVILITLLGAWPRLFTSQYTLFIVFPEAPGVTIDTPVRKSGIQIGRVDRVELRDEGGVLLTLKIDSEFQLRENEVCRISTGSLVTGDAVLEFVRSDDPALSNEPLLDQAFLTNGVVASNPFQVLTNLEGEIRATLDSVRGAGTEFRTLAHRVNTLMGDNEQQLAGIVDKAEVALDGFNRAMGTVETLFGDKELQTQLKSSLKEVPQLMQQARTTLNQVQTTLDGFGRVSARAERNLANLEDFTAPLGERGEEISENLVNTVRNVDQLLSNLVELSQAINSQEGSVGKLIHSPELYDRLSRAMARLEEASRKLPPIISDVRVFTDKIARDPRQLGVKGALDRRPSGTGQKMPLSPYSSGVPFPFSPRSRR